MKTSYLLGGILFVCLALAGCSLEEYNPSGGPTADEVYSTPEGYGKLINGCYYSLSNNFYGGEDYALFMQEVGTDIWQAPNQGWMPEFFFYTTLNSGTGHLNESWQCAYESINLCNAAISRIDKAGFTDETTRNAKVAEAHFIRAFYYFYLVEQFGGVYLSTEETSDEAKTDVKRSPVKDFYTLILSDLEFAKVYLPEQQAERGRATRAAAIHLYAKACLQRASYEDVNSDEREKLLTDAKTAAESLIADQATYGVSLYNEPAEIFDVANNKNNREALWVVTHTSIGSLNPRTKYWNRTYKQFGCFQATMCGVESTIDELPKFERRIMPSRFLLQLFGEKDNRYDAFFREKYYATTHYSWTSGDVKRFGKAASFVGDPEKDIYANELAMLFTRKPVAGKYTANYAVVDIDMLYNGDGTTTDAYRNYYPCLKKFEAPGMYKGELGKSYSYADNIVFRLSDTYLLAAEANLRLGDKSKAAEWVNVVRNRACAGHDHSMDIAPDDVDWNFILDERARELAGEHTRWIDLKRARLLEERIRAHNPEILGFDASKHYLRPVPDKSELNYQSDPGNFQNPGY